MPQGNLHNYRLVYSHLWRTYGQSWRVRLSFVLQFINRLCKIIALPVAISMIITALSKHDYTMAYGAVFVYVAFSFTLGVLIPLTKYIGMKGENPIYEASTKTYFSRLISADIDYFNSNLSGYLTTATRQYVDNCVLMVRAIRDKYLGVVLLMIFPLIAIMFISPLLGLVTLGLGITQAVYLLWASHKIGLYRSRSRELFRKHSGIMSDIISNILAVKASAQESSSAKRIALNAKVEAKAYTTRYAMQAKLLCWREAITVTFFLVTLWLTVHQMANGAITIGTAILVVTYAGLILNGIYELTDSLDEHDDFVDKIMPSFEILERHNTIVDPPNPLDLAHVTGKLELRGVSFAYENSTEPVLSNFSLTIPAKQKLGVVGLSGAGKSTLTKLLLRFNDVSMGAVLVDGIDVRDVRQVDVRAHMAYVPQEPLLFHSSIRDNIVVSRPDASEAMIDRALRASHADTFIASLPQGIESIVGERGVKLSGGQKQRIAVARAVLQDTPIIILDEATSALDSESEAIIKKSFKNILRGKTAIVVAHRLSTLSEMDRIIVIDDGHLVEDGTHDELVQRGGIYASLWQRQQRLIEDEI